MRAKPVSQLPICDPFYPVFLWREALAVVLLIAFQRLGQPANIITALGLVVLSLRNARGAIQALALVTLLGYLNASYFPVGFNGAAKWIVLLTASSAGISHSYRATRKKAKQSTPWLVPLLLFITIAGISSVTSGADPEMALFKLFTFGVGALGAMYVMGSGDLNLPYIVSWFYTVWVVLVMISMPLVRFGHGYISNTGMFMGILSHSQSFAVFTVPFTLYLLIRWLIGLKLTAWQKVFVLLALYLVYLSSSRNAAFSLLLTLISIAFVYYARGKAGIGVRARLMPRLTAIIASIIVLNVLTSGSIGLKANVFSRKYGEKTDILATRGDKIEYAQRTFMNHPVFGKGFGLAMDGEESFITSRDPVFGLPLSAPVEAGVIYTAVPAQLGIIGTTFLLFFLYIYSLPLFMRGTAPFIAIAAICFFINFGEYVFFSTGGVGMYHWLLYALAYHTAVRYPEMIPLPNIIIKKKVEICPLTT